MILEEEAAAAEEEEEEAAIAAEEKEEEEVSTAPSCRRCTRVCLFTRLEATIKSQ